MYSALQIYRKGSGYMKKFFGKDYETYIGNGAQAGLILSAVVITIGILMLFVSGTSGYPQNVFPTTFTGVWSGILMLKPAAVITAGLILLILTPLVSVGLSILLFLKEKDYHFTAITTLVLVLLISTFTFCFFTPIF